MLGTARHSDIEMRLDELSQQARPGTFLLRVRELSFELLRHGYSREELVEAFEHYRSVLRDRGQEGLEDELLDAMDQLSGWCALHAKL